MMLYILYRWIKSSAYVCTYVELNSIQMDKVIGTYTNFVLLYTMQMEKVIWIILYSIYPDESSHLHFYKLCYIFYENGSSHLHLYIVHSFALFHIYSLQIYQVICTSTILCRWRKSSALECRVISMPVDKVICDILYLFYAYK